MSTPQSRILHTMVRVADLEKSIMFYTHLLGMQEVKRVDVPQGQYTLAYVGYQNDPDDAQIELTYNYGVDKYEIGNAFGHFGVLVPDVASACERVRSAGGRITREPGPVKFGTSVIAFVEDPDGYKIELIQRG